MREYEHKATESTIAALRHLQRPWRGWSHNHDVVVVQCGTGITVEIAAEIRDLESKFEAVRLTASLVTENAVPASDDAFCLGHNDVVLFDSETWVEPPPDSPSGLLGRNPVVQYDGGPGSTPASADAMCRVTDTLLLDSQTGARRLIRCTWPPGCLEVLQEPDAIDAVLRERGYDGGAQQRGA